MKREFRQRNIDHYVVRAPLGEGGMGTVYRATDTKLQRDVALKVLLPGPYLTDEDLQRFVDEARITAHVSEHPNLVSIYNAARSREGEVYLSMELIQGGTTLQSWIDDGRTLEDPRPAAELLAQVCDGLQFVHDQGVVHRDLKPANVLITAEGRPILGDFGVAKADGGKKGSHTLTGTFMGTLAFASPEQATDSKSVSFKSDLYGIGAVLYMVLTGRAPHVGASAIAVMLSIIETDPPPPSELNPKVPPELEAVCVRALSRDPDGRYASATELAAALRAAARESEPASRAQTKRGKPVSGRAKPVSGRAKPVSGRARASRRAPAERTGGSLVPIAVLGVGALAVVAGVALSGKKTVPRADELADATPKPTRSAAPATGSPSPAPRPTRSAPSPTPSTTTPTASPAATPTASPATTDPSPAATPTPVKEDVTPPRLTLRWPTEGEVPGPRVLFDLAFDEPVVRLVANGKALHAGEPIERWRRVLRLTLAKQVVRFEATDAAGNVARLRLDLDVVKRRVPFDVWMTRQDGKAQVHVKAGAPVEMRVGKQSVWGSPATLSLSEAALRGGLLEVVLPDRVARYRLTDRPRLIFDLSAWVKANDVDRLGELLWAGAVLGPGYRNGNPYLVSGRSPSKETFPIGSFVHIRTRIPLLLIPGGSAQIGLRTRDKRRERRHVLTFKGLKAQERKLTGFVEEHLQKETPDKRVEVPPFLLGRWEVTEAEWDRIKAPTVPALPGVGPELPRGGVSWLAARAWLEAAGHGLRLPSDVEWEYAYRAGTTTRYFWGTSKRRASEFCVGGEKADPQARPRALRDGPRRANPFGLFDMAGNLWEWCADDWSEGAARWKPKRAWHRPWRSPGRPSKFRLARGGSCAHELPFMRASFRFARPETHADPTFGFRVARDIDLKPKR